jgi:hypothetical protein
MKNEVFLVTTALKEFFGNSNKRIALGEWCKVDENKYWVLKESDKEKIKIEEIKNKCHEFLEIFK